MESLAQQGHRWVGTKGRGGLAQVTQSMAMALRICGTHLCAAGRNAVTQGKHGAGGKVTCTG